MLYKDMQPFIDMMNNEQAGIILKAIYNYSCNNIEFKSDDSLLQSVFTFAKNKIDLSNDNYKKKCERNAENARKRWQKDNATACERIPEDANECLTKTKLNQTKLKETNITDIEKNMAFSTFWECYNYKVGKGHAIKTFNKLKQKDINSILEVVQSKQFQDKQKELVKPNGDFRKHPNTWLNSQGWEDEIENNQNNTSQSIDDGIDYELLAKLKGVK